MKKKKLLWMSLGLVFLIVFNAVFFIIGGIHHTLSAWISYAFIHAAFVITSLVSLIARTEMHLPILGFSLVNLLGIYFLTELLVGTGFIIANQASIKPALVVQIVLLGIFLSILLLSIIGNINTREAVLAANKDTLSLQVAANRMKKLLSETDDRATCLSLEKAFDVIRTTSRRRASTFSTSNEISNIIDYIEQSVQAKNYAEARDGAKKIVQLLR